jgi:excisionase family DNA binding protein
MARPLRLSLDEIDAAFRDEAARTSFPPILTVEQFARLFSISISTAYDWIAKDRLAGATTLIGKHRRIWRNRAIELLFNRGQPRRSSHAEPDQEDNNDKPFNVN